MEHERAHEVREGVATAYAAAIEKVREGKKGCCGSGDPAGSVAKLAGYGKEIAAHGEAGRSSFGCGNPLAFAGVLPGETVLDLGSGAGLDLLIAAERVGSTGRVIGVDMTDAMIRAARDSVARAGLPNVEIRKGLIEQLPVEDGSVDWVISNCVINLSPEKDRVFGEIHRVLRPGGRFSISDIVVDGLPDWVLNDTRAHSACVAGAISEQEYVAGLESAGLVEVAVSERITYSADQICGLVDGDPGLSGARFADLEGKVRSVRISGRRP